MWAVVHSWRPENDLRTLFSTSTVDSGGETQIIRFMWQVPSPVEPSTGPMSFEAGSHEVAQTGWKLWFSCLSLLSMRITGIMKPWTSLLLLTVSFEKQMLLIWVKSHLTYLSFIDYIFKYMISVSDGRELCHKQPQEFSSFLATFIQINPDPWQCCWKEF